MSNAMAKSGCAMLGMSTAGKSKGKDRLGSAMTRQGSDVQ